MRRPQKVALELTLERLKESPERWKFDNHRASSADIDVWTSNRYYATQLTYGSIKVGGFNIFWFLMPWEWWRVKLVRAVENAQVQTLQRHAERA